MYQQFYIYKGTHGKHMVWSESNKYAIAFTQSRDVFRFSNPEVLAVHAVSSYKNHS